MSKVVHLSQDTIKQRITQLSQRIQELKQRGPETKKKRLRVFSQLAALNRALEDPKFRVDPAEEKAIIEKRKEKKLKKLRKLKEKLRKKQKISANAICLGCKKKGHLLQDCRQVTQKTRICYKCGASDHQANDCTQEGFAFAVCFHCNEKGHVASMCPKKDKQGIYPRGGHCFRCGSVWHLAKNCTGPAVEQPSATYANDEPDS